MNTVIFVGGSTASGKTTLVNALNSTIDGSISYRRYQGFFDIAHIKGIPKDKVFDEVSSYSVDDWFVEKCKENNVVISDVHYAVQMHRDSTKTNESTNILEEYVPTISKSLISKLLNSGIRIIAVHISCSPEECLKRAQNRFNNKERELRAKSLLDVILENEAERREWSVVASRESVESIELDSESYTTDELVEQCLKSITPNTKQLRLKKDINKKL